MKTYKQMQKEGAYLKVNVNKMYIPDKFKKQMKIHARHNDDIDAEKELNDAIDEINSIQGDSINKPIKTASIISLVMIVVLGFAVWWAIS